MTESAPKTGGINPTILLGIVFFVSGCPALIYQLVWQRVLFTIYGVNIESITVVVSAFMLGLGIGSLIGGLASKRSSIPHLLIFAGMELCIGIFGLFSLGLLHWAGEATLGASLLNTGLLTFGLVFLPTALMGATLPLLVAYLVRESGNVGQSVGLLYFVNTLGSAFACFLVGWFLMAMFGMSGTITVAAVLNFAVGAGALGAYLILPRAGPDSDSGTTEKTADASAPELLPFPLVLMLGAATGFISLSYEILWSRIYSFTSGSRATAFPFMLGSYLGGIALGSLFAGWYCKKHEGSTQGRQMRVLGWYVLGINVLGLLTIPAIAAAVRYVDYHWTYLLIALCAGGLGATLPLISNLGIAPDKNAGSRVSYLYLANIIGSTSGSLVTGFFLMDRFSLGEIVIVLSVLGAALAIALLGVNQPLSRKLGAAGGLAIASIVLIAGQSTVFGGVYEKLQYKEKYKSGKRFGEVVETKSGVITVTKTGTVYGGGIYDGKFNVDLINDTNMVIRPYSLSAFHEKIERVLVIGVSSGSWTQIMANHPDVTKLVAIEINRGYLELIARHDPVKTLLTNPKVEFVIDDGRRWLAANPDEKFDAIVMNTTYHWRSFASNLLSENFLTVLRNHLNPGGIAFYNTTSSDEVQKTGASVFPHALRVINFMLVSNDPLIPDRERLKDVLLRYSIDGEKVFEPGNAAHAERLEEVLGLLDTLSEPPKKKGLESRDSILARTVDARLITDDNMGTEWTYSPEK